MSPLTDRQRNLLNLANQLSQNLMTANGSSIDKNVSLNLPGVDFDAGLSLGRGSNDDTPPQDAPETPATLTDVLLSLVNEQVEVTTPFGIVTGTLLAVRNDYIVMVEDTGAQVLVRIENIELVSEL